MEAYQPVLLVALLCLSFITDILFILTLSVYRRAWWINITHSHGSARSL